MEITNQFGVQYAMRSRWLTKSVRQWTGGLDPIDQPNVDHQLNETYHSVPDAALY